jgi:hypothetical protein
MCDKPLDSLCRFHESLLIAQIAYPYVSPDRVAKSESRYNGYRTVIE